MRTIKFRAWQPAKKKMLTWKELEKRSMGDFNYPDNKSIFQQFTGMKDRRNKPIYEGDLVKIKGAGLCRVDYIENAMKFYFQTLENFTAQFTALPSQIRIVGNIFENPELLK